MTEGNKPLKKFWKEGASISIWKNEKGLSATVEKTYKDKNGDFKSTKTFFERDLENLALILPEALQWLKEQENLNQTK